MPDTRILRRHAVAAAAVTVLAFSAGCEPSGPQMRADTFPMGQADRFDQPYPDKPLFGSSEYLRQHDVMPVALLDIREPLPAAVPLPPRLSQIDVIQPTAETAQPSEDQVDLPLPRAWRRGLPMHRVVEKPINMTVARRTCPESKDAVSPCTIQCKEKTPQCFRSAGFYILVVVVGLEPTTSAL